MIKWALVMSNTFMIYLIYKTKNFNGLHEFGALILFK